MRPRVIAPLFAFIFALSALAACGGASKLTADEKALSACSEAPDVTCDNGQPLCFVDHERVCRVCRCSAFALIPPVQVACTHPGCLPQPVTPAH